MSKVKPSRDIQPVTEFRANAAQFIEQVQGLERFEQQGRVVSEIGLPAFREVLHPPYRVISWVDAARVVILTLRHVRRAWDPTEIGEGG